MRVLGRLQGRGADGGLPPLAPPAAARRLPSLASSLPPRAGPGGEGGDCGDEEGGAAPRRQARCGCCCCFVGNAGGSLRRAPAARCFPSAGGHPRPQFTQWPGPCTRGSPHPSCASPRRSVVKFDKNACVLVNPKGLPLGTRVLGFVTHELRARQMMKASGGGWGLARRMGWPAASCWLGAVGCSKAAVARRRCCHEPYRRLLPAAKPAPALPSPCAPHGRCCRSRRACSEAPQHAPLATPSSPWRQQPAPSSSRRSTAAGT